MLSSTSLPFLLLCLISSISPMSISSVDLHSSDKLHPSENFRLTTHHANEPKETVAEFGDRIGQMFGEYGDDVIVLQVADRSQLVHVVLDASVQLLACDIVRDPSEVLSFRKAVRQSVAVRNVSVSSELATTTANDPLLAMDKYLTACEQLQLNKENNGDDAKNDNRARRTKRFLMVPGTYWCGMGSKAAHSRQLGGSSAADRCCMEHDGCPYFIPRVSSRYGLYNWRTHTLSYCSCDYRFHACLKEATSESTTAKLLGKVFFNVVNTACFELSRDKMCADYNWWGKCRKWKTGLVAAIQDTPRF